MDIRELTVAPREGVGKGVAKKIRRSGRTPGILYGGPAPVNIAVDAREVFRIIQGHEGSTQLLKLTFAQTSDSRMAIIRDMQFDPVSDNLIHLDLQEVAMDKPIQVTVALHHVGEAVGVRESQGILEMVLREVQVSCLPGNIPEDIKADVSNLAIGDVLTVGDLVVPEGVRVLTDRGQAVATVAPPAAEEVAAPVAAVAGAVAAAPAEPEVLTERKPKEEPEADDKKAKK
ncbi:MAG TPA: 50S ribosomal protein L25 [Candidatus Bathyarchaeia archaeon]|nr:50S ribosomal protein L25 [Candidatus Bathyarchaeia archaeon]